MTTSGSFAGRRMLVTGGGSGIGRGVVEAYVAAGATVTVLERSHANIERLRNEHPKSVSAIEGDATDAAALGEAVQDAIRGGSGLDNLTCCVGVFDYYASLRDLSIEQLTNAADEIWRTNVLSSLLAIKIALSDLIKVNGSITLTLSEAGFHAKGGGVLYGSSKWALRGIVSHLAKDLSPDVRVNGVAPGGTTQTKLGGLNSLAQIQTADAVEGRDEKIEQGNLLQVVATPADHAGAYLYLADSNASRIVTGTILNTDGGRA